jgi:hypothetical protein
MDQKSIEISNGRVIGILQPGYLPWLGFFEQMDRSDCFVLYDDVQYDKGGWRNRNRIRTDQGRQWLTVPVELKSSRSPLICDVKIASRERWQTKHIRTLTQYYHRARNFALYADSLFGLIDRPWRYLVELDVATIRWLARQLGIHKPIVLSSELAVGGKGSTRLIEIIKKLGGRIFYEGAAGRNYIDERAFAEAGISIVYQDYQHPVYPQCHGGFISHLSVVDLLFNCGPKSLTIIRERQILR